MPHPDEQQGSGLHSDFRAFGAALLAYGFLYFAFFARGLASGFEIAPGDALDFGLATFMAPTTVWTDAMYSGYPIIADPQALAWYPVFQLMRALGLSWSLFEISGYVLASATSFLLVRRLTGSAVAAALSGTAFGLSGIMLAHLNHFNQVHTAAWLPLVVYGLLLVRRGHGRDGGARRVDGHWPDLMVTIGHPQVVVYGIYVMAALVAGWLWIDRPALPRIRRYALWWSVMGALGFALAAALVLPAAELSALSRRAVPDWNLYVADSMPPWQLITLVFPLAFGGMSSVRRLLVRRRGRWHRTESSHEAPERRPVAGADPHNDGCRRCG